MCELPSLNLLTSMTHKADHESMVSAEEKKSNRRAYHREWKRKHRSANLEQSRAYVRKYYADNAERLREYQRLQRIANPNTKRKTRLKSAYGLTLEQWQCLFTSQGKRCAICEVTKPKSSKGWATDHCHATNKVRGILCPHCNTMLGYAQDNLATLQAAITYLEKHNERS